MQRSAELGQSIVALTDRDGLYAAVRWVRECSRLGIRPVLGVDIAVEATQAARVHPDVQARTPARGGRWIDETRPRVLLLATGSRGWASLCRLVSAAHIGDHTARGEPWVPWSALREHSEGIVVILGADSEVGRYLADERATLAEAATRPWRAVFDRYLAIGVTSHRQLGFPLRRRHRYSTATAARMLGWAREQRLQELKEENHELDRRDPAPRARVHGQALGPKKGQ